MTVYTESPLERLAALSPGERQALIEGEARKHGLSSDQLKAMLMRSWRFVGRPKQQAPEGAWTFWFVQAGRGFGKTITAAQWTKDRALERKCRIALVAPTRDDVRFTMFEGETGILSVIPAHAFLGQSREFAWNRSTLELRLANGTLLRGFSSEEPGRLRGPQHHYAWGEEVSSWDDAPKGDVLDTTFNNMKLGLRLGDSPQAVLTSTPRTNKLTKELIALSGGTLVRVVGSSYENRANLSEQWWQDVVAPLEGTRVGRQEIEAELLEDVEGALWSRTLIDLGRIVMPAGWQSDDELRDEWTRRMQRIVVAVDPNASASETSDSAGIVVCGKGHSDQHGYTLDDRTVTRGGPAEWSIAAVNAYHDWKADRIVAEKNNGGDMVRMVIKAVDPSVPVKLVSASRGKRTRAEPIATLYERKQGDVPAPAVHHVGVFQDLEDEMTTWAGEADSPDRMDALVWGMTDLEIWKPRASGRRSSVPRGQIPSIDPRTGMTVSRPRVY